MSHPSPNLVHKLGYTSYPPTQTLSSRRREIDACCQETQNWLDYSEDSDDEPARTCTDAVTGPPAMLIASTGIRRGRAKTGTKNVTVPRPVHLKPGDDAERLGEVECETRRDGRSKGYESFPAFVGKGAEVEEEPGAVGERMEFVRERKVEVFVKTGVLGKMVRWLTWGRGDGCV